MLEHKVLINRYYTQKAHARIRNIDWEFTFESWKTWWGEDIIKRGCKKGQLVMARYNDIGSYSPNNVYKSESGSNVKEMRYRVKGNGKQNKKELIL